MKKLKFLYSIYVKKCPENQIVYKNLTKKQFNDLFERVAFAFDDIYFYVFWNFLIRKYKFWWVEHFSRASYYAKRAAVIRSFNFVFDAVA